MGEPRNRLELNQLFSARSGHLEVSTKGLMPGQPHQDVVRDRRKLSGAGTFKMHPGDPVVRAGSYIRIESPERAPLLECGSWAARSAHSVHLGGAESPSAHRLLARLLAAPDGAGQAPRHPAARRFSLGPQAVWGETPGEVKGGLRATRLSRRPGGSLPCGKDSGSMRTMCTLSLMIHVTSWQQSAVLRGLRCI